MAVTSETRNANASCDPVCGETVSPDDAVASFEHGGQTLYFKHIKCKMLFERDPQSYPPSVAPIGSMQSSPGVHSTSSRKLILAGALGSTALAFAAVVVLFFTPHARLEPDAPPSKPQSPRADSSVTPTPPPPSTPVAEQPSAEGMSGSLSHAVFDAAAPAVPEIAVKTPRKKPRKKPRRPKKTPPPSARMYFEQGNQYLMRNKLERAVMSFNKCIEFDPKFAKAYGALGVAYARQNRNDLARQTFETYLREFPAGTDAAQVQGIIQEYQQDSE